MFVQVNSSKNSKTSNVQAFERSSLRTELLYFTCLKIGNRFFFSVCVFQFTSVEPGKSCCRSIKSGCKEIKISVKCIYALKAIFLLKSGSQPLYIWAAIDVIEVISENEVHQLNGCMSLCVPTIWQ